MKKLVLLTGAGISAESGLRTFRDSDGLWESHRVEDVATPMAWARNPELVLRFYNDRRKDVINAIPNAAHLALVKLEDHFDVTVITQNIDDLHERAGSRRIIHLHGEILKSRSAADPNRRYDCFGDIHTGDLCELGSQLRPDVVWFHEAVPLIEDAAAICREAQIFIVIGTSLQVYPAAGLMNHAPTGCHKFLVDPKVPSESNLKNIEAIVAKATTGVPLLADRLIKKFAR